MATTCSLPLDIPGDAEYNPQIYQYHAECYAATRDNRYKDHVVRGFTRMVVRCAKPFAAVPDIEVNDLLQEGFKGLIEALESYDPERAAFSTIAMHEVRGAIRHYIRDRRSTIRVPAWVTDFYNKEAKVLKMLEIELSRVPTVEEVAECMGYSVERYDYIKATNPQLAYRSFDEIVSDSDPSSGEDRHATIPADGIASLAGGKSANMTITHEERMVVRKLTVFQIAQALNVSFTEAAEIKAQL